jgi:hypothetical protein
VWVTGRRAYALLKRTAVVSTNRTTDGAGGHGKEDDVLRGDEEGRATNRHGPEVASAPVRPRRRSWPTFWKQRPAGWRSGRHSTPSRISVRSTAQQSPILAAGGCSPPTARRTVAGDRLDIAAALGGTAEADCGKTSRWPRPAWPGGSARHTRPLWPRACGPIMDVLPADDDQASQRSTPRWCAPLDCPG